MDIGLLLIFSSLLLYAGAPSDYTAEKRNTELRNRLDSLEEDYEEVLVLYDNTLEEIEQLKAKIQEMEK